MNQYKVEEGIGTAETELTGKRKLPWIVDIFLYPTSTPGLTNLGIFIVISTLLDILALVIGFLVMFLGFAVGLYICWYFAECVRDSANGGTRAPEAFATAEMSEMYSESLNLLACYLLFTGPPGFYFLFTHKTDTIFWLLFAYGASFFPMGLLAVIMFGLLSALNPILLIGSIFRTFLPYCGLVLISVAIALITKAVEVRADSWTARFLGLVIFSGQFYLALVVAHLLGRFYWRYQDKLNWEV